MKKASGKRIKRNKSIVSPLAYVVHLTQLEVDSFNRFTEERLMVLKCYRIKPKLREEHWEELRAIIFNGLVASYVAGISLKSRAYKLKLAPANEIKIIKRRD